MTLVRNATALLAVLALAGCGGSAPAKSTSSTPAASSSPSPTPTVSDSPSPSPAPLTGFSTRAVVFPEKAAMGGDLGPTGKVRVGRHDRFDRVVWEFSGSGKPAYAVEYVADPRQEGSGDKVTLRGDAYLQVAVSSVTYPTGDVPGPEDATAAQLRGTVVAEARAINGGFEGYGTSWIGVNGGRLPFRVTTLSNPTRLVVDIAHQG